MQGWVFCLLLKYNKSQKTHSFRTAIINALCRCDRNIHMENRHILFGFVPVDSCHLEHGLLLYLSAWSLGTGFITKKNSPSTMILLVIILFYIFIYVSDTAVWRFKWLRSSYIKFRVQFSFSYGMHSLLFSKPQWHVVRVLQ